MSKNLSVKRTLFTGTLLLTAAGILSRFIGFFYKIFLSRTIGAEGLGIYQLIFPIYMLCFSLCCYGSLFFADLRRNPDICLKICIQ